jgi:hypothetical protein
VIEVPGARQMLVVHPFTCLIIYDVRLRSAFSTTCYLNAIFTTKNFVV